jgi:uncharacterized membrane protein YsdA (DUF1294 family)
VNPYLVFGLLGFGSAGLATVLFAQFIPPVAAWIIAINLSALVMYRADKALAPTNTTRVPELILWLLEAIGGTIGAIIAMWFIRPRHKTQSGDFLFGFFVILVLQLALIVAYFVFWK